MHKMSCVESDWNLDSNYYSQIVPKLQDNNIPVTTYGNIPIHYAEDNGFWDTVTPNYADIIFIDDRHWQMSDIVFENYITNMAEAKFNIVALGRNPFGPHKPRCDINDFEQKLSSRMSFASKSLKNKNPDITIISPPICMVEKNNRERYLDFFIYNRSLFDVYALECLFDYSEQNTAILTAFLNQVLKTLKKPVWVTHWSVPSCDHGIESSDSIDITTWDKPMSQVEAANRMKTMFYEINAICEDNANWFFCGTGLDAYNPKLKVPHPVWNPYQLYPQAEHSWGFQHFMGCFDFKGRMKKTIFDTFMKLYDEFN